ncbi:kinase-like domain-containing protein [Corynascus novoguineensis]|uniref:Kinase-like domain-containing protein n=1 Tax=Corynascus novoguineensis TaxID=1126955 RepID=A0AAN7CWW1_9PEZI|nr:kinase-like domain-containing protein [Corynascus novoguineensis]
MAFHMEQLALFAVPRASSNDIDDDGNDHDDTSHGSKTNAALGIQSASLASVPLSSDAGLEILKELQQYPASPDLGWRLLWAARGGGEATTAQLLGGGVNTETRDDYFGRTPLSYAAAQGHQDIVKLLLKSGANIEEKDRHDHTPLTNAAIECHPDVVKLLLDNGAYIEAQDRALLSRRKIGMVEHHFHMPSNGGHEVVVNLLLDHHTRIQAKDRYDHTPLEHATIKRHKAVVKLLHENSATIEPRSIDAHYHDNTAEGSKTVRPPDFILAPLNSAVRKAVQHKRNWHLRYTLDDTIGIRVSFADPQKQIWTLGKGDDAAIYLPDTRFSSKGSPHISVIHASFGLVESTGAVLLFDDSDNRTVEPLPQSNTHIVHFRSSARSVLVAPGINPRIAFGKDHWYQFELQWFPGSEGLYDLPKGDPYLMGPRLSRTKKYVWGGEIGTGSYGTVSWVLDATNGKIIAVKNFHKLSGKNLEFATRGISNLLSIKKDDSIKHEHILEILDYSGGGKHDNWGEILMPLMNGNLNTLVSTVQDTDTISNIVLHQMLLALKCIDSHRIIHRNVKPENIVWEPDRLGSYRFCLSDFGLSDDPELARTAAGTEPFMAPEVYFRQKQTAKVDIWSLFATIIWTRAPEFRQCYSQIRAPDLHQWLVDFSKTEPYANIRQMASMDPKKRPSAKQQLAILDGEYDEASSRGTYGVPSGGELGSDLSAQFSAGMNLQDDTPGLTAAYETYSGTQAGPSEQDMPSLPYLAAERSVHGSWAMPYEAPNSNFHAPPVCWNSGSGTAVPDSWTAAAQTVGVDEESAENESRRREHKGKHRA